MGRKRLLAVLVAEGGGWVFRSLYSVIKPICFCRGHLWQEAQPRADGPVIAVLERESSVLGVVEYGRLGWECFNLPRSALREIGIQEIEFWEAGRSHPLMLYLIIVTSSGVTALKVQLSFTSSQLPSSS